MPWCKEGRNPLPQILLPALGSPPEVKTTKPDLYLLTSTFCHYENKNLIMMSCLILMIILKEYRLLWLNQ